MELGRANLEEFCATLLEIGRDDPNVLAITSDSRGSAKLAPFAESLPRQIVEMGIAEQNLVAVASGLAASGKIAFAVSPACFLTARSLEQIKNDVAYSDHPVKLVGISAGVSYGALGSTHHSLHDLAALRAINNIAIVVPADNFETREAIRAAVTYPHPIYIRFGKRPVHHLPRPDISFEIGRASVLAEGTDVTFIATGEPTEEAVTACEILRRNDLSCGVISMHTVKPLDTEAVIWAAQHSRALITVEEHSIHGGLGEACAGLLMDQGISVRFKAVGFPDEYMVTGSQGEIFQHYGLSPEGLADIAVSLLAREAVTR